MPPNERPTGAELIGMRGQEQTASNRLLIIDGSLGITGAFNASRREAELLNGGISLAVPVEASFSEKDIEPFEHVFYFPMPRPTKRVFNIIGFVPMSLVSGLRIARVLKRDGFECCQVNDFYLLHGLVVKLFGYKGRMVTWIRMDPLRFGRVASWLLLRVVSIVSDEVVAVSHFIRDRLPDFVPASVIHEAPPLPPRLRTMTDYPDGRIQRLIYLGHFMRGKGQEVALECFLELAAEFPDAELHYYGGDLGIESNLKFRVALEARANSSGHADRVHFHGQVADVSSVIDDAYAVLNFSSSEGFSLTTLEAQIRGVPVVATRCGGPEEILEHQKTGLLVDVGDLSGIKTAMATLLGDRTTARRYGIAAARSSNERFCPKTFLREVDRVLFP